MMRVLHGVYPNYPELNKAVRWLVATKPVRDWDAYADLVIYCPAERCQMPVLWRFPKLDCVVVVSDMTSTSVAAINAPFTVGDSGNWDVDADLDRINRAGIRTTKYEFDCVPMAEVGAAGGVNTRCNCRRFKIDEDTLRQHVSESGRVRLPLAFAT